MEEHVTQTLEVLSEFRICLAGKRNGKRSLVRSRPRGEGNIKVDIKEKIYEVC